MRTVYPVHRLHRFTDDAVALPSESDGGGDLAVERPVLDRLKQLAPGSAARDSVAVPTLAPGEQYRFHFDMTRCIGCRSCEVACNEQNNNPPEVHWRRVGEIEGGSYPDVVRLHLSMACNHCLEPSCLEGCPVDAYSKLADGIVRHDAETCIGCQYCTWNCPYGVPQFHPERRVVTKCNLCADRLADGMLPACVGACPTSAIELETVDVADWRRKIAEADAPGVPPADLTLSTTRITLPADLPETIGATAAQRLEPEAAHPSLIVFLTGSQWSVGLFAALPFLPLEMGARAAFAALAFVLGQASMAAALFHLGRPIHALRAMRAWRHSWLSREVIAFGAFALASAAPAALAALDLAGLGGGGLRPAVDGSAALCALIGIAGVAASAGIYRIPARPAWDSVRTPIQFAMTLVGLGAASGLAALLADGAARPALAPALAVIAAAAWLAQAVAPWQIVLQGLTTREPSLRGSSLLLSQRFRRQFWLRTALFVLAAGLAPLAASIDRGGAALGAIALAAAAAAELIGRYLFFVTVVPRNIAGSFFSQTSGRHG